jgi:2-polyprenyl-6-methoxyphenol hydroxylase-like FAD-dependent oxidoreductase
MLSTGSQLSSLVPADVAVVGAGPVGCVTALTLARAGAQVCLIDANIGNGRLAGEWLHPTGAGILADLGIDLTNAGVPHAAGAGFVIFPRDGADPITLPYADGEKAIGCDHHLLVGALRTAVAKHPEITLLSGYRVTGIGQGGLSVRGPDQRELHLPAGLIVGADGRQSVVRQTLGYPGACRPVSYMVGIVIDAASLPVKGYGHVFLGGPGPVLAFRVNDRRARVCIDVPADRVGWVRNPEQLLEAYRPCVPAAFHAACLESLADSPPSVAANQWLPRRRYGHGRIALVGDAVGHCHPLCAVGMTVGFLDALTLARSRSVAEYASSRLHQGRVPELLSMGLYDLFIGGSRASKTLRTAVYGLWRTSPVVRRQTMRLLAVRETRPTALGGTFARLLVASVRQVLTGAPEERSLRSVGSVLAGLGGWTYWLAREAVG